MFFRFLQPLQQFLSASCRHHRPKRIVVFGRGMDNCCLAASQTSHMNSIFRHRRPSPLHSEFFIDQPDFSVSGIFHRIHCMFRKQSDQFGIQIFNPGSDHNTVRGYYHASVVIQIFCNLIPKFRASEKFSTHDQMQIVVPKHLSHDFRPHRKWKFLVYCCI